MGEQTFRPSSSAKPKKPQNQAPKLLSFVDDEENATPSRSSSSKRDKSSSSCLGKPSSAHKMTALKDRIANSSSVSTSLPSNVQPQAGTYTKEALRELQKNTRTLSSSRPSSEPTIVLKGILKPDGSKISGAVNGARDLDSEDKEQDKERGGSFRRDKDDAESRLASMGIDKDRSEYPDQALDSEDKEQDKERGGSFRRDKDDAESRLASMGIDKDRSEYPDQATIEAIRKKRERLRKSKPAAQDFIALDSGSNHGAAEG